MKRFYIRSISTLMAVCLLFSFSARVSATETAETVIETPSGGLWQVETQSIAIEAPQPGEEPSVSPFAITQSPTYLTEPPYPAPENASQLYFYNRLSDNEKQAYNAFYYMTKTPGVEYVDVDETLGVTVSRMQSIACACTFDNPDIYWCVAGCIPYYYTDDPAPLEDDKITVGIEILDMSINARPATEADALVKAQKMQTAANRLLASIPAGPPAVMARQIHDILARKVTYDTEALPDGIREDDYMPHTAYNALTLVPGLAVCDGYAKAYLYLLRQRGITAAVVTSSDHAWNIVQLGNDWYEVDVTWDDQENYGIIYNWFNQTTANMSEHTREVGVANVFLPEAMGTHFTLSYLNMNGTTLAPGTAPNIGSIRLALNRSGVYSDIDTDPASSAWNVSITSYSAVTVSYTPLDSIIWSVAAQLPEQTMLSMSSPWSASSPLVSFNRLIPPSGTSSEFTLSIIYDNGAMSSVVGNLAAYPSEPSGDATGDGIVDVRDAVCAKQAAAKMLTLSVLDKYNADLNSDGSLNDRDVSLLLTTIAAA